MKSIENRMRMDGMSKEDIAIFTGEGTAESASGGGSNVNLNDPKFSKYHRMIKLKMPMKSILNRMKMDGLSQEERDAFSGKTGGSGTAKKKKSKQDELRELAQSMGLRPVSEVMPSRVPKMKRMHWTVVELSAIRKTFWWEINQVFWMEMLVK